MLGLPFTFTCVRGTSVGGQRWFVKGAEMDFVGSIGLNDVTSQEILPFKRSFEVWLNMDRELTFFLDTMKKF